MKRLLFTLILLSNVLAISAQSTIDHRLTFIYKITSEEAKKAYTKNTSTLTNAHFHTLVDTFHTLTYQDTLPTGYYLFVKAEQEIIKSKIKAVYSINVQSLNNDRDLALIVLDKMGNPITNATITIKNKRIPFDTKTQTYRLNNTKKKGFLTVKANGETVFYNLERDGMLDLEDVWWEFEEKIIDYFYDIEYRRPVRWFVSLYKNIYDNIDHRFYEGEWKRKTKIHYKKNRGYIALNQPKYKPGDTVKVKSYLAKKNGKPIKKPVELRLYKDYRTYKITEGILFKTILPSNKDGSYTYEFVLGDSLTLDKDYTLHFGKPHRKLTKHYRHISFSYEDYEEDEITYTFSSVQKEYKSTDKIILKAAGKDFNGNFIPDGNIKLKVYPDNILEYHENQVLIPDVIWEHEAALNNNKTTQIIIPKEVLPAAIMKLRVEASFYNSNGEYHSKKLYFEVDNQPNAIKITLENDTLKAKYYENGVEKSKTGNLTTLFNQKKSSTKIMFPYQAKINPYYNDYIFDTDDLYESIDFDKKNDLINCSGMRTSDSIFVRFSNPRGLPIIYSIEKEKTTILKGQTTDKNFTWKRKDNGGEGYFIQYQYVWCGKTFNKKTNFKFYKNLLNITLEQPTVVAPNETVQVKVTVKDVNEKAVKNMHLTAGAINSTFGTTDKHFHTPSIKRKLEYKKRKNRNFNIYTPKEKSFYNKITPQWYSKLELQEELFYRLRFPTNGIYQQYDTITTDTFYQNIAQFAPYIVKEGKEQAIHLIYCNKKLVYYSGVSDYPTYSFIGREGLNQITIRTLHHEYTLNNVLLKKGQKLEISFDENQYTRHPFGENITKKEMPPHITEFEERLLKSQLIVLRRANYRNIHHVLQGNENIHVFSGGNQLIIGPFLSKDSITLIERDGVQNTFLFESGYSYEIDNNRERLYEYDFFPKGKKQKHSYFKSVKLHYPKQLVYAPSHIITKTPTDFIDTLYEFIDFFQKAYGKNTLGTGKYEYNWNAEKNKSKIIVTALIKDGFLYKITRNYKDYLSDLEDGKYTLLLYKSDSTYFEKEINIKSDTLLYENLESITFKSDTNFSVLRSLQVRFYKKNKPKTPRKIDTQLSQRLKMYEGSNLITGKVISSEDGLPLIGCNVFIEGTIIGTTTDIDGNYQLNVPEGVYNLRVEYLGYTTELIENYNGNSFLEIALEQDDSILEEVVVVGYGISHIQQDNTIPGRPISMEEIANLPSKIVESHLTGTIAGVKSSNQAVNGIKIRGSASISDNTEPLYVVDGVPVLMGELELSADDIGNIEVLRGETSTALYGARAANGVIIIMTKEGIKKGIKSPLAALKNTPPTRLRTDFRDYAYWQPNLMTDKNGEAYFSVTFPDNVTSWRAYAMGMDKKSRAGVGYADTKAFRPVMAQLSIPRFLVEGDETEIVGKSVNYTLDTFDVKTTFKQDGKLLKSNDLRLSKSIIEKASIKAGLPTDSLQLSYELARATSGDGEERSIPVFRKGIEETIGGFYILKNDTTLTLDFDKKYNDVTLYAQKNILEVLLEDIDFLKNYSYGCNEQTASKLMALLMERKIRNILNQPFKDKKAINKAIQKLQKTQNEDGSWGWWQNGKGNIWITIHVLNALQMATQENFKVSGFFENGKRFLSNSLHNLKGKDLIKALVFLSNLEQNVDYDKHIATLDTTKMDLYDKFSLIKIAQANNQEFSLDSVRQHQKRTTFGAKYWGEEEYLWFNNKTELTLLAYEIFKKAGDEKTCDAIIQYFLERRNSKYRYGRNTFKTAKMLATLLPDMTLADDLATSEVLTINNQTVKQFPYTASFSPDLSLKIEKKGSLPIFLTTYQQFHNKRPKAKTDIFDVTTTFSQDGKIIKKGHLVQNLPVKMTVSVEVKSSADYVMIEVPIPAGCSYESKRSSNKFYEVHREYFKHKTSIFCEYLPTGTHTFSIMLEPRFTGNYTLNPAKAEQMYFPIFYGRNELEKIKIDK